MRLRHVVRVGAAVPTHRRVHQHRVRVHANEHLHPEIPPVVFPGLMYLGIARTRIVLGRKMCSDDGGIHRDARSQEQSPVLKHPVDDSQNLLGNAVLLQRVPD